MRSGPNISSSFFCNAIPSLSSFLPLRDATLLNTKEELQSGLAQLQQPEIFSHRNRSFKTIHATPHPPQRRGDLGFYRGFSAASLPCRPPRRTPGLESSWILCRVSAMWPPRRTAGLESSWILCCVSAMSATKTYVRAGVAPSNPHKSLSHGIARGRLHETIFPPEASRCAPLHPTDSSLRAMPSSPTYKPLSYFQIFI